MGRYKLGPNGAYYDANDSGPDQASPEQISALNPPASAPQTNQSEPPMYGGGYTGLGDNPTISGGGVDWSKILARGGVTGNMSDQMPAGGLNGPDPNAGANAGAAPAGFDQQKWATMHDPKYDIGRLVAAKKSNQEIQQYLATAYPGWNITGNDIIRDPQGNQFDFRFDQEGKNLPMWEQAGGGSTPSGGTGQPGSGLTGQQGLVPGMAGGTTTGVGSVQGQNVFSDPATTSWETLLRSLTDKLNQQQPTWTPAQLDLQQTQALDPLERQRQAQKQAAQVQLASRGIQPGSGIYDTTMRNIDNQFNQYGAQTRGNFATQAINREDQVFNNNESRATNAVNLMRQIPQLADQRLAAAQSSIQQTNPAQLLALQNQIQNQGYQDSAYQQQQQQQFWQQLAAALAQVFS